MGRATNLRDLLGKLKDKVSQSKAALLSNPKALSLHLALLRATTHDPSTPPNQRYLTTLLSFGNGSRSTAASAIDALMDRLQNTRDAAVAIKCLITVHHIIKHGGFILQDQLSVYPSTGGRNYLNLSNFRDNSTALAWELSSWVRWYALYLEQLLATSRILGFFLCSSSRSSEKDKDEENVSSRLNCDLLKETDSLVNLLDEMSKRADSSNENCKKLLDEVMGLVGEDSLSAINEVSIRVNELKERLSSLSFGDSVELVFVLKRLEDCKEKLSIFTWRKRVLMETFWGLIGEVKDKVGNSEVYRGEGRFLTMGSRRKASASARFDDRVPRCNDLVRFSSGILLAYTDLVFQP
ncbi:hypothetical protein SLEP1_g29042 [Rubroshorea leprosula]|uniref:ENTH domain-containing protein n=1 Tax=Rubroshorea leprosula TaxID=152421 RepID=A0AAV5K630_9ROSI|nr:hypothetical protein SLEP1_g29042 [Rubroshorea leprosula]